MTRLKFAKMFFQPRLDVDIVKEYCPMDLGLKRGECDYFYGENNKRCVDCWNEEFIKDDALQVLSKRLSKQDETSEKGSAVCGNEVEKYAVDMTEEKEVTRKSVLDKAAACVLSDRQGDYGAPEDNFRIIAELWMAYLAKSFPSIYIKPKDVAVMMVLLKIARITNGNPKNDNWVDIAGYAACGGELEALEGICE